jgi:hypothetical protein
MFLIYILNFYGVDQSLFPVDFVSHDVVEIVSCYESIVVQIGLHKNFIKLFVIQIFSQFVSNLFKLGN